MCLGSSDLCCRCSGHREVTPFSDSPPRRLQAHSHRVPFAPFLGMVRAWKSKGRWEASGMSVLREVTPEAFRFSELAWRTSRSSLHSCRHKASSCNFSILHAEFAFDLDVPSKVPKKLAVNEPRTHGSLIRGRKRG